MVFYDKLTEILFNTFTARKSSPLSSATVLDVSIANSMDQDQTAPGDWSSLIWVHIVCMQLKINLPL